MKGVQDVSEAAYVTVSALTKYIKRKFDVDPHLEDIWIKGELSNVKIHTRGHIYFTLKDEHARMQAVMFQRQSSRLAFKPEDGMKVIVRGGISVYEPSGSYQLYAKEMQPDGVGALYLAYEELKKKLAGEGLFDDRHKQAIPAFPATIGVVTSPTGAAVRDVITTLKRRYPLVKVIVLPALVQGENASRSIVKRIEEANAQKMCDVLIVGRGGGSIEELWAFNEEIVARRFLLPPFRLYQPSDMKQILQSVISSQISGGNADRSGRNRRPPHDGLNGTDKNGGSPPDKSDAAAYQQEKRTGSIAPVILRVPFSETIVYPKRTAV